MQRLLRRLLTRRFFPLSVLALNLFMAGCATHPTQTCPEFEERQSDPQYATQYRFSRSESENADANFKPLPPGKNAMVRLYRMHVEPVKVKPCRHLTIHKEIYLQRTAKTWLVLEEIREFYAGKNMLITTKKEPMSGQLRATGYYASNTLLPIPAMAPPGKYRIVSRLMLRTKDQPKARELARTSVIFEILAPN